MYTCIQMYANVLIQLYTNIYARIDLYTFCFCFLYLIRLGSKLSVVMMWGGCGEKEELEITHLPRRGKGVCAEEGKAKGRTVKTARNFRW